MPSWLFWLVAFIVAIVWIALFDRNRARVPPVSGWPRPAIILLGIVTYVMIALLILFLALIFPVAGLPGSLLFWRLVSYIEPKTAAEKAALVQAQIQASAVLVQIFGGVVLIGTLIYTLKTIRIAEEGQSLTRAQIQASQDQIQISQKQLEISQDGLNTDRFIRAIEQLGATDEHGEKKMEVRLGGIFALDRLSQDSKRDRDTILSILSAYVRTNAPAPETDDAPSQARPPEDIRSILNIIRNIPELELEKRWFNLSRTDLRGAILADSFLVNANFEESRLDRVDLSGANLKGAYMTRANLSSAGLMGACMQEAVLEGATLNDAYLVSTNLEDADLTLINLTGAVLDGANFKRARLVGADFHNAHFAATPEEIEESIRLWNSKQYLARKKIFSENYPGFPSPVGESVPVWMVAPVQLQGADLTGAAGLTQEQIDHSYMDDDTILPEGPGPDRQPYRRSTLQPPFES